MSSRIYVGIFLKSFAILMFEVCLMRILSITLWHHFAFLIISCALLGYGVSGSWLLVFSRPRKPFWPAFLFAGTLLPLILLANSIQIKPALLSLSFLHWFSLVGIFLLLSIPFFFSGLTLNTLFRRYPQSAFKLYCFDLIGASGGCGTFFIVAPFLKEFGWIALIMSVGFLSSFALSDSNKKRFLSLASAVVFIAYWSYQALPDLHINQYKSLPLALKHKNSQHLETRWNAVTKVDWFKSPLMKHAPGLSLNHLRQLPPQTGISIDNDRLTASTDWAKADDDFIDSLPIALPFKLSETNNKILILNALGGDTILPALRTDADIHLQTENTILGDWHRQQPHSTKLTVFSVSARSFLAGSQQPYDKIFVSLEGSLPSGLSGVGSLKTNSLITREGMRSLLKNLDTSGWLVFHSYLLPPPRTELRLLATLYEEIDNQGLKPDRHIGVLQTIATLLIVFSPREWNLDQTDIFLEFCDRNSFIPIIFPNATPGTKTKALKRSPLYAHPIQRLFADYPNFHQETLFDVEPLSDNRPYFNFFLKFSRFADYLAQFDYKWEAVIEGGLLVIVLLGVIILISILTIGLPYFLKTRDLRFFSGQMIYFFWIGLGFMSVEIALIEKLTLFLGEPVYSFTITLCCLLLASAIGAGYASKVKRKRLKTVFGWLILVLIVYGFFLSKVLLTLASLTLWGRILVGVVSICTIGLFLGYFFPHGIAAISTGLAGSDHRGQVESKIQNQISLAWCYNGIASVIGSVGSIFICQVFGINTLFFLAAFFYFLAYLGSRSFRLM